MIKQFLCIGLLILVIHSSYSHNVNTNTAGSCIDLHCVVCKSSNATCDQCQPNYYEVKTDHQCKLCGDAITNCSACQQPTVNDTITCSQCNSNFILSNNTCLYCGTVIDKCTTCTSTANKVTCTKCILWYFIKNNMCLYCGTQNCVDCKVSTNFTQYTCKTCAANYYVLPNNTCITCQQAVINCSKCSQPNAIIICNECNISLYVVNNMCASCGIDDCWHCSAANNIESTICSECAPSFYLEDNTCLTCGIQNCESCQPASDIVQCLRCSGLLYYLDNTCISCSKAIHHCNSCEQTSISQTITCLQCDTNYYHRSSVFCETCGQAVPNCHYCQQNNTAAGEYSVSCQQCNDNYYISSSNTCITCSQAILGCNSCLQDTTTKITKCSACSKETSVSSDQKYCFCTDKTSFLAPNGICRPCTQAITDCTTCQQNFASITVICSFCGNGKIASMDGKSCQCNSTSFLTKDNTCNSCGSAITDCITCTQGVETLAVTCSSCGNEKTLSGDHKSCQDPSSSNTLIIVLSVVGGVAVISGLVLTLYKRWKKKKGQSLNEGLSLVQEESLIPD